MAGYLGVSHAEAPVMADVPGIAGYSDKAPLSVCEEIYTFENVHPQVVHLFPKTPSDVLDIGAGTGRDAAGFAALGHRVVAVEPVDSFRKAAQERCAHHNITWVDDGLPYLETLASEKARFDLVMMTAVLMHLDEAHRAVALAAVAPLMKAGGLMILMLRHGPVPAGRTMFDVGGAEIRRLGDSLGLNCIFETEHGSADANKVGVSWTRIALRKG
jgi:protein-L-isoaspartate O-methyltransferase